MKQNERQTPLVVQKVIVSGEAVMPHSDEMLEEAVLGALLIETSTARRVIPRIWRTISSNPNMCSSSVPSAGCTRPTASSTPLEW